MRVEIAMMRTPDGHSRLETFPRSVFIKPLRAGRSRAPAQALATA